MLVRDLIDYSLRLSGILGVGQTPLQQDEDDAQRAMVMMMAQWQRRRWLVFRLNELAVRVNSWQATYTIGPSGDLVMDHRPATVDTALMRQTSGLGLPGSFPIDYPLQRIRSREAWNEIPFKRLGSWPARYYYDPTLPNGTLYVWPIPIQSFFELHVSVPTSIDNVPPEQEIYDIMPPEAEEAIAYNLACRLRANYALPPRQDLVALALTALNTMRVANFGMRALRMPAELQRPSRLRNPMAGHYPELSASVPFPVLS